MRLHGLHGGLALAGQKQAAGYPILDIALPDTLVLPLVNYRRELLPPQVSPGERVIGGQPVAAGVLAGTSGTVVAIEDHPFVHPSGGRVPCVIVQTDHQDERLQLPPQSRLTIERLLAAGVQGMGGAGFATADKLQALVDRPVDLLIINAAECEPQIACDAGLLQASAAAVVDGIRQLADLTRCARCCIAIEQDSTAAIASLQAALAEARLPTVELQPIPPRYPSGAESTLVRLLSGRRLQAGQRPTDHGMLCVNVATAFACGQAARGRPLYSRITTVGGDAIAQPRNVHIRFGTPVAHVLSQVLARDRSQSADTGAGSPGRTAAIADTGFRIGAGDDNTHLLWAGGPFSGFELTTAAVPVTATGNCLLLSRPHRQPDARACIRCGQCAEVCPAELLPQQLYRYAVNDDGRQLQRFSLPDCITCGCCDLVCPAAIPLTATFRHARSRQRELARQESEARRLAELHAARENRLQRQADERAAEQARLRQQLDTATDPVAAALARARARRARPPAADSST